MALVRAHAMWSPDETCPRPFPCHRAAAPRSHGPPNSAATSGSAPETSSSGSCERAVRRTSVILVRANEAAGPYAPHRSGVKDGAAGPDRAPIFADRLPVLGVAR